MMITKQIVGMHPARLRAFCDIALAANIQEVCMSGDGAVLFASIEEIPDMNAAGTMLDNATGQRITDNTQDRESKRASANAMMQALQSKPPTKDVLFLRGDAFSTATIANALGTGRPEQR